MRDFNLNKLVRTTILNLQAYSSARDEFSDFESDLIFLDANENPFQTEVNRYPDPQQRDVKSVLAAQKGVSTQHILLGNGSDEVLDLIFRVFCEPSIDNVITLPPTYGMYKVLADINGIENREVLLTEGFELNTSEILKTQDSLSKLLFICAPNNPTGSMFSQHDIEMLLNKFNGLVVIDEAYIDFSECDSWLTRLEEFPNLIITQTFSKAYGMAGIRLGICYASVEIIAVLNKIKPPYNVNELTQQSAFERLIQLDVVEKELSLILNEKERLLKALLQVYFVSKIHPSQANFLLVEVDDANLRYQQLITKGIVVRNRSSQPLCKNTLRITIGTEDENNQLIENLKSLT